MIQRILFSLIFIGAMLGSCKNASVKEQVNPNECTKYACPMHPDKTSTVPGKCPECNMNMEPVNKKAVPDTTRKDTR